MVIVKYTISYFDWFFETPKHLDYITHRIRFFGICIDLNFYVFIRTSINQILWVRVRPLRNLTI